jgi:hypothetical protein
MNPRFRLVSYEQAPGTVKAIYEETMREMGIPFVLNWFKCQGSNPLLLEGNWAKLRSTMLRGEVPFILNQLIIYNISIPSIFSSRAKAQSGKWTRCCASSAPSAC